MSAYPSWDKTAHWVRVYRARIRLGLETCRECGCVNVWGTGQQLTLDHIHPRARGGNSLMENATILCADCNGRKGDGPAKYRVSLWVEEWRAPRRQKWSRFPVPEVPPGPWDNPDSRQPPRTPRGVRRAVALCLPEWARPLYMEHDDDKVPIWVRQLILSRYEAEEDVPQYVQLLLDG